MLQSKIRYGMSKMLQMALQHIGLTIIVCFVPTLVLQASVSSLRAEWQSELAGLKSELDHKRRQAAAALKAKQEEEDLKVRGRGAARIECSRLSSHSLTAGCVPSRSVLILLRTRSSSAPWYMHMHHCRCCCCWYCPCFTLGARLPGAAALVGLAAG
jgi:hypothetical protein